MSEKSYVLEWSKKQNCFHIQPLENTLAKNQQAFINDTSHDYLVLMIGTHEVVTAMADNHRNRVSEREKREITELM